MSYSTLSSGDLFALECVPANVRIKPTTNKKVTERMTSLSSRFCFGDHHQQQQGWLCFTTLLHSGVSLLART